VDKVDRFANYLAEGFGCAQLIFATVESGLPRVVPVEIRTGQCSELGELLDASSLSRSIIVCRPEGELHRAGTRLQQVRGWLDDAPAGVLAAHPDTRIAGPDNLREFLREHGLKVPFTGWVADEQRALIAVLESNSAPSFDTDPNNFRVVALMATYNESDIIQWSLRYLIEGGINVYIIDNWSTDGTFERVQDFVGKGVIGVERFPAAGPTNTYEWRSILARIETLSETIEADWFMLQDADERRHSPWQDVGLKAGLHYVDRCGFNCVDHVVLNYSPTDNRFDPSYDVESQLRYYSFSDHLGHFHQRKAWKNPHCAISLAPTAGHDVCFPGRLVYPFKFLMKHYPIRSQAHGERKVFQERATRWSDAERSLGWHQQYDDMKSRESFLGDPASLEHAAGAEFDQKYLIERLSGIGVFREPPAWATPPRHRF
jgi:hypothetical protein